MALLGLLAAAALASSVAPAVAADVTTIDGKKFTGTLKAIAAEYVTLQVGGNDVQVPSKQLLAIEFGRKPLPLPPMTRLLELELIDGSTLRLAQFRIRGKRVETQLAVADEKLPPPRYDLTLDVVSYVMRNADDPQHRAAWKKMLANRPKRDLYVTRDGDTLNYLRGIIHQGSEDGARLEFEREAGERISLLLSRATGGLVFHRPQANELPPALCKVQDVFGNVLNARQVELKPDGGVRVLTACGVLFDYPAEAAVSRLDFAQGNLTYLSDRNFELASPELPPEEKNLRLSVYAPVLRDRQLSAEPLKIADRPPFAKGLLIAPDTVLTFDLGGEYRELQAVAGLPESLPDGSAAVRLTIAGDGQPLFSEVIRRRDPPRDIALNIRGVRQLRIIVEGDFPINGNRLILGDARVVK